MIEPKFLRYVVIDDDDVDLRVCVRLLRQIFGEDVDVSCVSDIDEAKTCIADDAFDVYLIDHNLSGCTAIDLMTFRPDIESQAIYILMSGDESREVAIASANAGMSDYLNKAELSAYRLERTLNYSIEAARKTYELREAKALIEQETIALRALTDSLARTQSELQRALGRAEMSEERYRALAQQDLLTGLPNHGMFGERIAESLAQSGRNGQGVALMLIDIDDFKAINDSLGHSIGDQVLVAVANRLQKCARQTDVVGRLAGDEFAILLQNLKDEGQASVAAERVLTLLDEPFDIAGHQILCAASVGIATSKGTPPLDAQTLRQRADIAIHRAKQAGGTRFQFFDAELHEQAEAAKRIKSALGPSMERDEFHLVFQPRVDLQTGRPCGAEALLRWIHPKHGFISPAQFIPVAEASGQILPLCDWVMDAVFKAARRWRDLCVTEGYPLMPIAMNLSSIQLRSGELRSQLGRLSNKYDVHPALIELEVTETAAVDNIERTAAQLAALRNDGYRVAIDDFGTGYASLALAVRLPADYLKIDRSFVSDILQNPGHAAAVATTLALGQAMQLCVVAEGIETEAEAEYLRNKGCHEAQGFHFAKPMKFDDLIEWMAPYKLPQGEVGAIYPGSGDGFGTTSSIAAK